FTGRKRSICTTFPLPAVFAAVLPLPFGRRPPGGFACAFGRLWSAVAFAARSFFAKGRLPGAGPPPIGRGPAPPESLAEWRPINNDGGRRVRFRNAAAPPGPSLSRIGRGEAPRARRPFWASRP